MRSFQELDQDLRRDLLRIADIAEDLAEAKRVWADSATLENAQLVLLLSEEIERRQSGLLMHLGTMATQATTADRQLTFNLRVVSTRELTEIIATARMT